MTLDEARKKIEENWTPHPQLGDNARAATGEPYVTIVSGAIKKEGDIAPFYATQDEAIAQWFATVLHYGSNRSGTLYWRCYPELERDDKTLCVYSRLLISDKPQVQPQRISQ